MVFTVQTRPYVEKSLYKLDVIASLVIIFTLLSGILYLVPTDINKIGLSICIIIINVILMAGFLICIFNEMIMKVPMLRNVIGKFNNKVN